MNVILLVVGLVIAFFVIQNNNRFTKNNYPLTSSPRGEKGTIISGFKNIIDTETKVDKRRKLVNTLRTISDSDKVVLTEVVDKWSLNKNIIDPQTNKKSIEIIKDVMNTLEYFSGDKFYVKNIENIYVMKDRPGNFRTVISAFIYDIKNFHTVKIIVDVVYFENIMYVNHIDIDESGIKNVLQHYDIKYKSSGILSNYNTFDKNVETLLDNYYKERYNVIQLKPNSMVDLSGAFSFSGLKSKLLPQNTPTKSSLFCNKELPEWSTYGIQYQADEDCAFNNPSIRKYPPQPLNLPNGIVNNVDINSHSWMWDPDRGHSV